MENTNHTNPKESAAHPYVRRIKPQEPKQLMLFTEHPRSDLEKIPKDQVMRIWASYRASRELARPLRAQELYNVLSTFNLYPAGRFDRHLQKAGFKATATEALRSDWAAIFEDITSAFLKTWLTLERRSER